MDCVYPCFVLNCMLTREGTQESAKLESFNLSILGFFPHILQFLLLKVNKECFILKILLCRQKLLLIWVMVLPRTSKSYTGVS